MKIRRERRESLGNVERTKKATTNVGESLILVEPLSTLITLSTLGVTPRIMESN
jgi:hypothetical protein